MDTTIHYLFDPLCGWCYGASAGVEKLVQSGRVTLDLIPTGLFSGAGARPVDEQFAEFAWRNDQRIHELTGLPFSERYQRQVLNNYQRPFDSGPATLALVAVYTTDPDNTFGALKAIQQARFVDGQDVTDMDVLAALLTELELNSAAEMLVNQPQAAGQARDERTTRAHELLRRFGITGVPGFIADKGGELQLLSGQAIYNNPQALLQELGASL